MKKLLPIICLAALLNTFFFPAQKLYATNLDECLLEALKNADGSVTVDQLHEQCQAETGAISKIEPEDSSAGETSLNGPMEMVLKTEQAKKPAYFPHNKHQKKYLCGMCHHGKDSFGNLTKYNENTVIYKCTSCHNPNMLNEELSSFQLIGHKLCRECHRKNQDITSAKCSTCHRTNR